MSVLTPGPQGLISFTDPFLPGEWLGDTPGAR
jgi:hypothetical protein